MSAKGFPFARRLILASSSPQRFRLLREAGYEFESIAPGENAECGVCSKETPPELVARLAYQKALDVRGRLVEQGGHDALIVACDTVAECLGQILGKPRHRAHARQMLELLKSQEHHVYSGLCLWPAGSELAHVQVARTKLRMDPLSESQIEEYLDSGQWEGKAGAFGYQDRAGWLHIIEGSESNVIGLPLELLADMLASLGDAREALP